MEEEEAVIERYIECTMLDVSLLASVAEGISNATLSEKL